MESSRAPALQRDQQELGRPPAGQRPDNLELHSHYHDSKGTSGPGVFGPEKIQNRNQGDRRTNEATANRPEYELAQVELHYKSEKECELIFARALSKRLRRSYRVRMRRLLSEEGWDVAGVDNDVRQQFFGPQGTTQPVVQELMSTLPRYRHLSLDIRDRQGVRDLFERERPEFIIHTAAQPYLSRQGRFHPLRGFRCERRRHHEYPGGVARFLPGLAALLHQHQQGLRRSAERASTCGIGETVGLQRRAGRDRLLADPAKHVRGWRTPLRTNLQLELPAFRWPGG